MNVIQLNFIGNEYDMDECRFTHDFNEENYIELEYYIDSNLKIEEILNDKKRYDSAVEYSIAFNKEYMDDDIFTDDLEKNAISYEEFINNPYEIYLVGNKETVIKYVKDNNLENIDKNVVMSFNDEHIGMDSIDTMQLLMDTFKNSNNLYINTEGNLKAPKLKDYYDTMTLVNNIVNEINDLDLSPLEKLMYLYDKVRDRYYILESEGEGLRSSRDLTSTILGENIVCEGFATIFNTIAEKLGLNSRPTSLDQVGSDIGHERNMVYVEDKKYKYKGFLFFDPTWDCKRSDDDNHFNKYQYFGLTFNEFAMSNYNNQLISEYNPIATASKKINKENKDFSDLSREEKSTINRLYRMLYDEYICNFTQLMFESKQVKLTSSESDIKKITIKCKDVINKFTNKLSLNQFIKLLYNVRKKEYYINPEKFPLSKEKIIEIVYNSRNIKEPDAETKLIAAFFGQTLQTPESIIDKSKIDKDINRVKVAKTLRNVLENKKQGRNL